MKWSGRFLNKSLACNLSFMQFVVAPGKCFTSALQSKLTFFDSSQSFRCFIMLAPKIETFFFCSYFQVVIFFKRISYFFLYIFMSVYVFCRVLVDCILLFFFFIKLFLPEGVFERFLFEVLICACNFGFLVVVVDDVVMVVASLL